MEIVGPGDKNYDADRRISNARFDYRPSLICYCDTKEDVPVALRLAREKGLAVRVRSGGHHHEGMCSGDGVLMVDVSRLNRIDFDEDSQTVWVGPGAKLADVYQAVWARGLLFPGGACGDVRVGGLVQGGGWGLFTRALGLTCDWLHRFRMVTWFMEGGKEDFHEIEVMGAASDPNVDLYWAVCGGGGGNFGVATEFQFKLVPFKYTTSKVITQFSAAWKDPRFLRPVLDEWRTRFPEDDEYRLTSFCRLIAPGSNDKPVLVSGNFVGDQATLQKLLPGLLPDTYVSAEVTFSEVAVYPPAAGASVFTHPQYQAGPPGAPGDLGGTCSGAFFPHKVSSAYPRAGFDASAAQAIVEYFERSESLGGARRYLSLHSLGGVVGGDGSRQQWSCFAYRDKPFLLQYQAWWEDEGNTERCLAWVRGFRERMSPHTEGAFINFPDRDLVPNADTPPGRKALLRYYYGQNLDRLIGIKQRYDPRNVFDFGMGIPTS